MIGNLRGDPRSLAGSLAMPFMIGPGTVSASVVTGAQLPIFAAIGAIGVALFISLALLLTFKAIHDVVKERNAELVDRYVEIAGRVSALVIGTIAVEMIFQGLDLWLVELRLTAGGAGS